MPSPFPCGPVIRECSWKKTQIEKKKCPYEKVFLKYAANLQENIHANVLSHIRRINALRFIFKQLNVARDFLHSHEVTGTTA